MLRIAFRTVESSFLGKGEALCGVLRLACGHENPLVFRIALKVAVFVAVLLLLIDLLLH